MNNNTVIRIVFAIVIGLFLAAPVFAQEETGIEGDDTITVLGEGDRPEAVDRIIMLPSHAPERAVESSRHGLETANQARERNQEENRVFGLERAREAREQNIGEQVRDRVMEKERAERPDKPDRPERPAIMEQPGRPERPEMPERPELPERGNAGGVSESFRNNR